MLPPAQGAAQTAYRIMVKEGSPNGQCVWDSGEVACGKSVGVKYAGTPLKSATKYFWTVSVKDETDTWLKPSPGFFETGLFKKDDWNGSVWISAADAKVRSDPQAHGKGKQEAEDGTACFVKTIPNGKDVQEAYWTVAGLGAFEAYVNGEPVSRKGCKAVKGALVRDYLKPGFTHNGKTKYSFTYDVTHLMKTGEADANTFAAQVSSGWWRDKIVNFFGKKSAFRAQLILRYADGTEKRIGTDTTWLSATTGPVIRAAIFDGEDYDARVKTCWMKGKPCDKFRASEVNTEFKGELFPMTGAPIRLREDIAIAPAEMYVWKGAEGAKDGEFGKVKKLRSYKDGDDIVVDKDETLVVDFAQNAAAIPCFIFSAAEGVTLKMRPAEMLNDGNGAKKRGCDGPEGSAYFTNYRQARTTLNYTFAGTGEEKYRPNFTFFGYRYVSITATGKVTIKKLRSIPVTSIPKWTETGCLETGVKDVNQLISNVKWGQYSNYLSVPTDCPQRNERLGWTADTQVFTEAASYNADVYGFFMKWMRDMRDTQHDDGSYTGVAPMAQYGSERGHQLGWADAGIIVPYTVWKQFGDTRVVEESWESMKRYMKLLEDMKYTSPQATSHQWADWLSYEKLESCSGAGLGEGSRRQAPREGRRPQVLAVPRLLLLAVGRAHDGHDGRRDRQEGRRGRVPRHGRPRAQVPPREVRGRQGRHAVARLPRHADARALRAQARPPREARRDREDEGRPPPELQGPRRLPPDRLPRHVHPDGHPHLRRGRAGDGLHAPPPAQEPVVALLRRPGRDDDLGALELLHEGGRLRLRRHELLQPLRLRRGARVDVRHDGRHPGGRGLPRLQAHHPRAGARQAHGPREGLLPLALRPDQERLELRRGRQVDVDLHDSREHDGDRENPRRRREGVRRRYLHRDEVRNG